MRSVVRVAIHATFPIGACSAVAELRPRVASSAAIRLPRDVARKVSYGTRILSLNHRLRNRRVLTVATFHRVLKRDDPRGETALHLCTLLDDVFDDCELCSPRVVLDDVLALRHQRSVDAVSFPHGTYTSEMVDRALAAGHALAFTGDAELCTLRKGFLASPLIGRIEVDRLRFAPTGRLRSEMLAIAFYTATRGRAGHVPRNLSDDQDQLRLRDAHAGALRAMTDPELSVPLQKEG
jgi:hypothetical protein